MAALLSWAGTMTGLLFSQGIPAFDPAWTLSAKSGIGRTDPGSLLLQAARSIRRDQFVLLKASEAGLQALPPACRPG